ncbi:MAG: NAD(P)(+) transhydrogenase (Re/Si-specific) subunit alpha, partial [Actinobacteria bacterium]|nr:NAD(P)(+) transhydrogenase (Re/Si-specific) subunit alpha [Actinomycetota bacterium]
MARLGIVKEGNGETRVAATPDTVAKLLLLGYEVVVERGAGAESSFPDSQYKTAGAIVADKKKTWASEIVMKVNAPTDAEIASMAPGTTVIGVMAPGLRPELLAAMA